MTDITTYTQQDGSTVELRTIPGYPPLVSINGVIQNPIDYRIVGHSVIFEKQEKIQWKPWYAWHPVCIKGKWYWLTQVYRCRKGALFKRYDTWIYGDDFDRLKDLQ